MIAVSIEPKRLLARFYTPAIMNQYTPIKRYLLYVSCLMKLLELSQDNQSGLLTALLRFTYPLYCATGVKDFDYHFIGSCFPLRAGERIFFIFTAHQFKLALGNTILIPYPESTEKMIGIESDKVAVFDNLDLAIFEFSDEYVLENLHKLDISLITEPDKLKNLEYAVLGCHREVNALDYESKEIVIRKGALLTEFASIGSESPQFDFSNQYMVAGTEDTLPNLKTINQQTQGLSGSPVVAFTINEMNEAKGDLDLHLVGVATHVSETNKKLYAAHPMELVSALQYAFKIFPWYENN